MRRNGISKVITNDALRNVDLFSGKSAISYIVDEFNNLLELMMLLNVMFVLIVIVILSIIRQLRMFVEMVLMFLN